MRLDGHFQWDEFGRRRFVLHSWPAAVLANNTPERGDSTERGVRGGTVFVAESPSVLRSREGGLFAILE